MNLARCTAAAFAVATTVVAAQEPPSKDAQIAGAVMAAPEDRRAGATVLGWDSAGKVVPLRTGTNDQVCIADNPQVDGFNVACYHKDLEPFMARGRELTARGITEDTKRDATRWQEVEAGALPLPRDGRMLAVTTGKAFDPATGQIADGYTRWVMYVPFATAASTGLGTKNLPGVPWLMDPGTAGAHIMISPARPAAPPHQ